MCRYPSSSAHRTALTHSGPLGTCQTPRPSIGISLPSASTRALPSAVTALVVMALSLVRQERNPWNPRQIVRGSTGSQRLDESTVDGEIGAGDVPGTVAGQEHDQVRHFLWGREPACGCVAGRLLGDRTCLAPGGAGNGCGNAVIPEPERGRDR